MATVFLSSILSKTSQALGHVRKWAVLPSSSSDPRSSLFKDLEKLERTLKRIHAVLHDAEEKEIRDESVKLWLKELKEVAYDAEDVLDEYQYEVRRSQVEGRASLKRKRVEGDDEEEVSITNSMGDRIRKIRKRFDEISEERQCLSLKEKDGERRVYKATYPEPTSHMVDESRIHGRKDDKQEVIDLLFSEGVGNDLSVIPIVGKGGLGKTTIAQLIYNDPKVKQYFHLTGWVCVSDDFDVPRLTKDIIESLTPSSCQDSQLSKLQDTLKEVVKGKRVLLVLDDIWNERRSRWESLRSPFSGAETVTIIMTCRNDSVAEIMQTVRPYHPGCLSPEQSWSLFSHYAFGGRDPEEQPHLVHIGEQIVKKCSGLPLALKSMGSFLRCTTDEDSWMDVIHSDVWEVDENDEILPALRLSYSRMPAHLKPCFIYCSMFPKDYEFDKEELVRLWIAQGYIQTSGDRRSMEDIGNEYFNDLQRRSVFDFYDGAFKMHDMIHDLAKSITGNECCAILDKKLPGRPDEVRHLYVEEEKEFVKLLRSYNFSTLRTLLLRDLYTGGIVSHEIIKIKNPPLLRYLRSLEFCWDSQNEIPDLFGNLKYLRYLHISSYDIEKLPQSICLLYQLQILVLHCSSLAELPDGVGNLTNLRHFELHGSCIKRLPGTICHLHNLQNLFIDCGVYLQELPGDIGSLMNLHDLNIRHYGILSLPAGIEKLKNLKSLVGCYKVQGAIGVLKNLVNLRRKLYISGLRNMVNMEDARDASLKHKNKLEELLLQWNVVDCNRDPYHVVRGSLLHLEAFQEENKVVPADEKREEAMLEYLQPPTNLKKLLIDGYGGSKFPKWVGNPLSFASLQEIRVIHCKKIRSLPLYIYDSLGKSDAPIPKSMLVRVYIFGCQHLTSIIGLHNLHSLEDLDIEECPQLLILSEEGLPSKLKRLKIYSCKQLASLSWMQNLHSLEDLEIEECPQLLILSEEGLPSKLKRLKIYSCEQLASLSGMQNLASLKTLMIQSCPKLQIMAKDQLSSMPEFVEVVDCPGLCNWCHIQNINCIQVLLGNKLTISKTWEKIMHGFDDLTSIDMLHFSNSWEQFSYGYKELKICRLKRIPQPRQLLRYSFLRSLVIKDCPGIHGLPFFLLPCRLKSLVVDNCEDLRDLPLAGTNRDALEELQLVNCPKLERVEGLNCQFFPKILRIEGCPQLQLPQHDQQPCIPPRVEIADEGNTGEFLQLMLPSGSSSQSTVQITVEPSNHAKGVVSQIVYSNTVGSSRKHL